MRITKPNLGIGGTPGPDCIKSQRRREAAPKREAKAGAGLPKAQEVCQMRIVDVREITQPIASPIRNAYIDFSKMTTSLVAVVTDVVRDGKPVVGYGFNSNGRYGQGGLIRERFAPRLKEADPRTLLNEAGDNLDPDKVWSTLMSNEKPGGHD